MSPPGAAVALLSRFVELSEFSESAQSTNLISRIFFPEQSHPPQNQWVSLLKLEAAFLPFDVRRLTGATAAFADFETYR